MLYEVITVGFGRGAEVDDGLREDDALSAGFEPLDTVENSNRGRLVNFFELVIQIHGIERYHKGTNRPIPRWTSYNFV